MNPPIRLTKARFALPLPPLWPLMRASERERQDFLQRVLSVKAVAEKDRSGVGEGDRGVAACSRLWKRERSAATILEIRGYCGVSGRGRVAGT